MLSRFFMPYMLKIILPLYFISSFCVVAYSSTTITIQNREAAIVRAVNAYRVKKGLQPLKNIPFIVYKAREHARDMQEKRVPFGHAHFTARVSSIKKQITSMQGAAENVAWFPPSKSPEAVVALWLTSGGHRRNIMGPYNKTGVGVVRDARGWFYYTQIFVRDRKDSRNAHFYGTTVK